MSIQPNLVCHSHRVRKCVIIFVDDHTIDFKLYRAMEGISNNS